METIVSIIVEVIVITAVCVFITSPIWRNEASVPTDQVIGARMVSFEIDAYKGWTEDQLRKRCVELVRANVGKDMLICVLRQHDNFDDVPQFYKDQIDRIVATYCGDGE